MKFCWTLTMFWGRYINKPAYVYLVDLVKLTSYFDCHYQVKIGLWIDLTNTTRFYDNGEVESNGCRHVKLCCKGHGETPTKNAVATFNQICSTFISRFPTEIIGESIRVCIVGRVGCAWWMQQWLMVWEESVWGCFIWAKWPWH